MLKALIDRQNDHLAGAAQLAVHQHLAQLAFNAWGFAFVFGEDFLDDACGFHRAFSGWKLIGLCLARDMQKCKPTREHQGGAPGLALPPHLHQLF